MIHRQKSLPAGLASVSGFWYYYKNNLSLNKWRFLFNAL